MYNCRKLKVMKKMLFLAVIAISFVSCSKTLISYTAGIEKKINGQEMAVQYFLSSDLTLRLSESQDTLVVNDKGELERQKNSSAETFFVKAGTRGVLSNKDGLIYWIKFDPNDDRLVPFMATGQTDGSQFVLATQGVGVTKLSDDKFYTFRGVPSLKVSQKSISKIDGKTKNAKGVKVNK